jgi:hypothetical protein
LANRHLANRHLANGHLANGHLAQLLPFRSKLECLSLSITAKMV